MSAQKVAGRKSWTATLIIGLFVVGVAVSAIVGWRYARESPPHQGPIVLIVVDSYRGDAIGAGPRLGSDTPAIDALAADSVVFSRAYTHSTTYLPALTSIATGQWPTGHGVRDDAGFPLPDATRTIAELLRNRGFVTGGAVSTFLLRRASGLGQGFAFYDAAFAPPAEGGDAPATRPGIASYEAAAEWMRTQGDERYFLMLDVDREAAEPVVSRLVNELKAKRLYDGARIVLTSTRGAPTTGITLDEAMLHVPLVVKQPSALGAGRVVDTPVQHADIVPTLLDFVRAPIPGGLGGRSLRPVLDDADVRLDEVPIYAESREAVYRFGGYPLYSLALGSTRLVRGAADDTEGVTDPTVATRLASELDTILERESASRPGLIEPADERTLAALGYLAGLRRVDQNPASDAGDQRAVFDAHRAAVRRLALGDRASAIAALRAMTRTHPMMPTVLFQLGTQLEHAGRLADALTAFKAADVVHENDPQIATALASVALKAGRRADARAYAEQAVARTSGSDVVDTVAARVVALEVALASNDAEAATMHVTEIERADPGLPLGDYVEGRLALADARYADAAAALENAARALKERAWVVPDLQVLLGDALVKVDRSTDAVAAYRSALDTPAVSVRAYAGLATLYRSTAQSDAMTETLDAMIAKVPTVESYAEAARIWTSAGNRQRATALRAEARRRFRGDPGLASFQ